MKSHSFSNCDRRIEKESPAQSAKLATKSVLIIAGCIVLTLSGCGLKVVTPPPGSVESKMVGGWRYEVNGDNVIVKSIRYEIRLFYTMNSNDARPAPCLFGAYSKTEVRTRSTRIVTSLLESQVNGLDFGDNSSGARIPRLKVTGSTATATESSENMLTSIPYDGTSWTLRLDDTNSDILHVTAKKKTGELLVDNMKFRRVK